MRRISRVLRCALAGAGLCLLPSSMEAQTELEYQVKAAFLLNFAKFVEWPSSVFADADAPVTICILGKDPFGRTIDELVQGEVANGRKLLVRRMSQLPAPQACQVAFAEGPAKQVTKTLTGLGQGVLTVGEGDDFVRDGGIIAFVIENRRVRFDINQTAAENAALKLSSKLLSVARSIEK
jgi:hypothetical protein